MPGDYSYFHVRFQIDVESLLEHRSIFADPEQFWKPEESAPTREDAHEYGKTFIVPGGVPTKAIHRWDLLPMNHTLESLPDPNEEKM